MSRGRDWARAAANAAALGILILAGWRANRAVCAECTVREVALAAPPGMPLRGRLYLPTSVPAPLPAVVVLHGYLANLAFVEVPWARDLAALGCAVLLVDRRGHGRSGGDWWPPAAASDGVVAQDADAAAALAYLRHLPAIDPSRLAVLGHSDGGTAAIIAGSTDWGLSATVALSASIAPAVLVNHVAPRNLLLTYGGDDHFIVNETDTMLISAATRGYLAGPGRTGNLADGSARRLLEVPDRGHVDLLYSEPARRAVLEWLRVALHAHGAPRLSPDRRGWVAAGALALCALLACAGGRAAPHSPRPWYAARIATLAILWGGSLLLAAWLRGRLAAGPGQEGATILAILGSSAAVLGAGAGLVALAGSRRATVSGDRQRPAPRRVGRDAAWGGALGIAVAGTLLLLLRHLYDAPLSAGRWGLFAVFLAAALAAFSALEAWLGWIGGARAAAAALGGLAAVTAIMSPWLFPRMSVLPAYLLAATLVLAACHRLGAPRTPAVAGAVMAAVVFARLAAGVDALY